MPVQTLRLAQPPLTQNKTMKKQLLTLALLAVAGTAGAQYQLPNGNFEGGTLIKSLLAIILETRSPIIGIGFMTELAQ